jgi:hypothetical protein
MERNDDLIELGVASIETRGFGGLVEEDIVGKATAGLSDDA